MTSDLYFSECHQIAPDTLEEFGAFDISLASHLPLVWRQVCVDQPWSDSVADSNANGL